MAVTALELIWEGETTTFAQEFRQVSTGVFVQERRHVVRFQYVLDNFNVSTATILAQAITAGLPVIGSLHPDDTAAWLATYNVTRNSESANHGNIDCNYTTSPNPLDEPAGVSYGDSSTERVFEGAEAFVNADGSEELPGDPTGSWPDLAPTDPYPITNSAFNQFIPPPADQESYMVLTITKNLSVAQWAPFTFLQNYVRRINSAVFTVKGIAFPIKSVFLARPPRADEQYDKNTGVRYYRTSWEFWCRERGWDLVLGDFGYRELNVASSPEFGDRPIYGQLSGAPVTEPVKLDGQGQKADQTQPTFFLRFRVRKLADFTTLPILP